MVEEKQMVQDNLQKSADDVSQQLAEVSSFNSKLEKQKEVRHEKDEQVLVSLYMTTSSSSRISEAKWDKCQRKYGVLIMDNFVSFCF